MIDKIPMAISLISLSIGFTYSIFKIYKQFPQLTQSDKEDINILEDEEDYENEIVYNPNDLKYLPSEILDQLECGISGSYFKNPLISPYGHSFEKKAIVDWLQQKKECPYTKQPLYIKDLRKNKNLKSAIEFFQTYSNNNH